jgi:hypothetical protein
MTGGTAAYAHQGHYEFGLVTLMLPKVGKAKPRQNKVELSTPRKC